MTDYGSVCSGVEAASIAWEPLGMRPAWFSEIEPFPCSVLAHHWPHIPNVGDMTTLPTLIRTGIAPAPEVLVGGTPCQAFSVAGGRLGLGDKRGQLTMTYVEVLNAIDERRGPGHEAVCVWENVPGVLSSKDNAFGCFLAALCGEDEELKPPREKWANAGCVFGPQRNVAWRILDAQYFGLAQRRRRVFVVASARANFDPLAVLFEFQGVRRDHPPSRETGEEVAGTLVSRTSGGGFPGIDGAIAGHIQAVTVSGDDVTHALNTANNGKGCSEDGTGRGVPTIAYSIHENQRVVTCSGGKPGQGYPACLTTYPPAEAVTAFSCKDYGNDAMENLSPTLRAMTAQHGNMNGGGQVAVANHEDMKVRRLMPVECERLQGFPDGHTDVPHRGKPAADGPRYKAIGNSKAVPVVNWIGERLLKCLKNY